MNFMQNIFPKIRLVTPETLNKGKKVILQHFSNFSDNAKQDSEQIYNSEDQSDLNAEYPFNTFEIKLDGNLENQSISSIGDSLRRFEIKSTFIKEPIVNTYLAPLEKIDDPSKNSEINAAINRIGKKGVEANWRISRKDFFEDDNLQGFDPEVPKALDECEEDVSHIGPVVQPSVNFASIADKSPMVQELCKLGVDFYKIEQRPADAKFLISLDYEKDIKPYIQFLNDCSVDPSNFGAFITKNPRIFKEDLEDLKTRIRYLRAHAFNRDMISRILTINPLWLSFNTRKIDERLGYFQYEFKLTGNNVRKLAVMSPLLITHNMELIKENTFAVKEEMGFDLQQMRCILLNRPALWKHNRMRIVQCFDYVHNNMKISHEMLTKQPDILLHRRRRVHSRNTFLKELNKAQYDPTKPNYISPSTLVEGNDVFFCENTAKTSIEVYNLFLKSI